MSIGRVSATLGEFDTVLLLGGNLGLLGDPNKVNGFSRAFID